MTHRNIRGGSYLDDAECPYLDDAKYMRFTFRFWSLPECRVRVYGFRLVVRREG